MTKTYDVVIVGAGIQGATMALEVVRRGLRPLVIERAVPGGGTTSQSLGIVHGGLRYLQRLDLVHYRRSCREQTWFLRELPELVSPLACVMPLYRGALRSRALFRTAFLADRTLSRDRSHLPPCTVLTAQNLPLDLPIPREGLAGGACWYDAVLDDAPAAVATLLSRSARQGATCLAGAEAIDLIVHRRRVVGLCARTADGKGIELKAPAVILCAGPASRGLARRFDRDCSALSSAVLAFNLVLDLPAPGPFALAVSPTPGRGRSYFVRPHAGGLLAGTWYVPWSEGMAPQVDSESIERALSELQCCFPGLESIRGKVRAVTAGVLPDADGTGRTLRNRDVLIDHGSTGGVQGLYSILGVKLTTARALSERAAQHIWPAASVRPDTVASGCPAPPRAEREST